jgi:hypothetical protein
VNDLTLTQLYPETRGDLKLVKLEESPDGCTGPAIESIETLPPTESGLTKTKITFKQDAVKLNPNDRSSTILCMFDVTDLSVPAGSSLTYILIGEANYDYTLTREAPNIIVDQTLCGADSKINNQQPAGGSTERTQKPQAEPVSQGSTSVAEIG